jgi:hypothetical protein
MSVRYVWNLASTNIVLNLTDDGAAEEVHAEVV